MSTILIGVDDTSRSEDAIAFGRTLAGVTGARLVVANAFPYSDVPNRAANLEYRTALERESKAIVKRMAAQLSGPVVTYSVANHSPAHALTDVAEQEGATIIVVGSTHTGRAGRVYPGSTGERLLHGAPCAVAIVPRDYRTTTHRAIRRVVVGSTASDESRAAVAAATAAARALGAELEVVGVISPDVYGSPMLVGAESIRADVEAYVQEELDAIVAGLPATVRGEATRVEGDPAEQLAAISESADLLIIGSRGYGPLRAVLAGGVSGRVARDAHCPVIVVPRGIDAPLGELFTATAAAGA